LKLTYYKHDPDDGSENWVEPRTNPFLRSAYRV